MNFKKDERVNMKQGTNPTVEAQLINATSDAIKDWTYITPLEEGLVGHAKNRMHGRYRERPAFHDMANERLKRRASLVVEEGELRPSAAKCFSSPW
jgi:hypothetical protein